MQFDENAKPKVYNIDLDGTLTNGEPFWKQEPVTPNKTMIEALRNLYKQGNIIIVWTARQWEHAPETVGWLIANRVPFHGIMMGKGGADVYVDDKALSLGEFKMFHTNDHTQMPACTTPILKLMAQVHSMM